MSCTITLKDKGYRLTPQRRLILDIIHEADAHLTAEAILDKLEDRISGVNKSTVYRVPWTFWRAWGWWSRASLQEAGSIITLRKVTTTI